MLAEFVMRGAAVNSSKEVQLTPEIKHTFASGQLGEWVVGPMELKPGINVIRLNDPLWSLAQVPLLVSQVQVRPATSPSATNQPPGGG